MVLDPPNILIEDGNNNYDDPNDAEENEYNHDDNVSDNEQDAPEDSGNDQNSDENDVEDDFPQDQPEDVITEVWDEEEIPDFFEEEIEEEYSESFRKVSSALKELLKWQLKYSVSDGCLNALLKVIKVFLAALNVVINSNFLTEVLELLPETLHSLRKVTGINRDDFDQYIVCPECNSLYKKEDVLVIGSDGKPKAKRCSYVPFKHHPQKRFRTPCNAELLKKISNASGSKENFYPKKVYCYRGIKRSFQEKLLRKGFLENLLSAPQRSSKYSDIYDGKYYSEFKDADDLPFFNEKRNIGLLVNFDFFNPFKKSKYSLGVVYAVIVNLPRKVRFLWENVLVLGIIPGPREPKLHINTYLRPFVDELLIAWSPGIKLVEPDGLSAQYQFGLFSLSCDLPALRKIGGFLSHNAKQGKSQTLHQFVAIFFSALTSFVSSLFWH
ncbi:uncharacterized protein [Clytia hemisphaerica]|uniref:uncharacterized protein n=1 Tax=Clytia hemisphaerica TaxID=252671 RepID=UPI0034D51F38